MQIIHAIFGSTSDEKKVLPGIMEFTKSHPKVEVQYASADNTPNKTQELIRRVKAQTPKSRVFVSGAGLSNVLTGVIRSASDIPDVNIGIPISDTVPWNPNSLEGMDSLLSTSQKPPLNPVLTVGMNNSHAAVSIARRFQGGLGEIAVLETEFGCAGELENGVKELVGKLGEWGMPFTHKKIGGISSDDVVVRVFGQGIWNSYLKKVDDILARGRGVQVGVCCNPLSLLVLLPREYLHALDGTVVTGMVNAQGYDNAVMMAAQLTRNYKVLDQMAAKKTKKSQELLAHNGYLVSEGRVLHCS